MSDKKEIRRKFREAVFKRDGYRCAACGMKSSKDHAEEELDSHHITNRNEMPNGGYVKENGIALCKDSCHKKAEEYHSTGVAVPGYSPDDLYKLINSDLEKAIAASERLKP